MLAVELVVLAAAGLLEAVFVVAGLLAVELVVELLAEFDGVFVVALVVVFDVFVKFVAVFLATLVVLVLAAPPPQANVSAINDKRVTESKSLFFIY